MPVPQLAALLLSALTAAAPYADAPPAGMTLHAEPTWIVRATAYQPHAQDNRPHLDRLGGGPTAAWTGQNLRPYHCAVGTAIPLGTKLWVGDPFRRLVLAVDTGSAVRGRHVDVCCYWPEDFRRFRNVCRSGVRVWKVGEMDVDEAREWAPEVGDR